MFKKISRCLIYSPALMPLYSIELVSISIIACALGSLVSCDYKQLKSLTIIEGIKIIFPYSAVLFLYVISLLWTDNIASGLKYVEYTLSFLIFPLIFLVLKPLQNNKEIVFFIKLFILSTSLLSFLTLLNVFFKIENVSIPISDLVRKNIQSTYLIGEHPIYFSLLLAVGVVLLVFNKFESKLLTFLIYFINILGIVISGSRGVFISLFLVSFIIIFLKSLDKRKIITSIILLFFLVGTVVYLSPLKQRMAQLVTTEKIYPEGLYFNSFNIRMAIYKCSLSIIKDELLIGHGAGDIEKRLSQCYEEFNTSAFDVQRYNTHNQYFHYLCAFGLVGTIIILYYFGFYLRNAYVSKNWNHFTLLILFYLCFFTENILVRNTGIVVFSMINCIFVLQANLKKNEKSINS